MALAFNIDEATFNSLESQVQGLYTKTDDGYQLAIDGLPDTKGLKVLTMLGAIKNQKLCDILIKQILFRLIYAI